MLNIPEYKEYAGETQIALMDNSSLAFMHELSQRSYPSDGILSVYDLILIPKWVMEEIEDSTYRSTYVEQLQAKGYPIRWIDETKYGAFVNDEDVNLYYIVEAAVSRVSELMRFLRRKVKTEDGSYEDFLYPFVNRVKYALHKPLPALLNRTSRKAAVQGSCR